MAQQTAVEILKKQLRDSIYHIVDNDDFYWFDSLFEQAKEMEKQQKKRAWVDGNDTHRCITSKDVDECFDDYYNETYGNDTHTSTE